MKLIDEQIKTIEERNKMFNAAQQGEKPICPKCKKGHILCKGKSFFYCDNDSCDMRISVNYAR